jgi:predicted ArsR family transcriptional regulator
MRYSSAMSDRSTADLDSLALLGEPVRRKLYEYVVAEGEPVDRDRAAAATEIGRSLAAFHLDRLVDGGLLEVEYHRRSGRTGPGAGRPAKFYRRAAALRVEVSMPPRRYGLAAEILADGLERSGEPEAIDGVLESARAVGERLAASAAPGSSGREALVELLRANGYEPFEDPSGAIRLRNCPFHALVERHRDLTCSMNLALLQSVVGEVASTDLVAEPRPTNGFCCVAFVPTQPSGA